MNVDRDETVAWEAADWLRRLKTATPEEQAAFWKWLKLSAEHPKELLAAQASDVALRALMRDRHDDVEQWRSTSNVCEFGDPTQPRESRRLGNREPQRVHHDGLALVAPAEHLIRAPKRAQRTRWFAAAAVFCLAVIAAAMVVFESASERGIETRAGEWQTRILEDGTVVRVGPRTKLTIEFTPERRVIRLAHGEALFHVAKNPQRPFLVVTGSTTARAIGTAFAVNAYDPEHVRVTVKEGIVAVTRAANFRARRTNARTRGESVTLQAGEQAAVTPLGPLATKQVDIEVALAWATGRLIFVDETVAQAVLEFNRRNEIQIQVRDEALLQRQVRGQFDASDPQKFARQLEGLGAVSVMDEDSRTLLIAPDPHPMAIKAKN